MEPVYYTVRKISGDYALMISDEGIENTVAMALLPIEICEGDRVLWQDFNYQII